MFWVTTWRCLFVVVTISSSFLVFECAWVTRLVPLVKQEVLTLLELLSSFPILSGIRVAQSFPLASDYLFDILKLFSFMWFTNIDVFGCLCQIKTNVRVSYLWINVYLPSRHLSIQCIALFVYPNSTMFVRLSFIKCSYAMNFEFEKCYECVKQCEYLCTLLSGNYFKPTLQSSL